MTGLFQSWLRRLVHTADAHRDRMWGVVARIAAAAVVVAAVQHHASQMYEAWRSEQQEGHQQRETKFFPKRPDDVAEEGGDGVEGRDDTRTRTDRAGADRANGPNAGFEAVGEQDVLHVRGRGVVGVGGVAASRDLGRAPCSSRRGRRRRGRRAAAPAPPTRPTVSRTRAPSFVAPRGAAIREVEARVRARVRS